MKRKIVLPIFLGMLILTGCQQSEDLDWPNQPANSEISTTPSRSIKDAINIASEWMNRPEISSDGTRAEEDNVIENIEILTAKATSASSDTLLYLINYANLKGYAIIGAKQGNHPVYAFSEKGNLSFSDTVSNLGFRTFVHSFLSQLVNETSTRSNDLASPSSLNPTTYTVLFRQAQPMLPEAVANWNQGAPYNLLAPTVEGKQGVVGCVPLAVGQLLAYYKAPQFLDGKKLDWDGIVSGNNITHIAYLLETLASEKYTDATYVEILDSNKKPTGHLNPDSRSAFPSRITTTMQALGFDVSKAFKDLRIKDIYNRHEIFSFMDGSGTEPPYKKAPVLMGVSLGETDGSGIIHSGGHRFVVDGYKEYEEYSRIIEGDTFLGYITYLHCIWGEK
ncbi:MAG: hypothetical protein HDR80_03555, partial [Bacteroides sp.]|nr:hypothetical protein [Bacteroides sp.]